MRHGEGLGLAPDVVDLELLLAEGDWDVAREALQRRWQCEAVPEEQVGTGMLAGGVRKEGQGWLQISSLSEKRSCMHGGLLKGGGAQGSC